MAPIPVVSELRAAPLPAAVPGKTEQPSPLTPQPPQWRQLMLK